MTNAKWTLDLISAEWDSSADPIEGMGEIRDGIEMPELIVQGAADDKGRASQLDTRGTLFVKDGGDPIINPQSVGYREEYIESKVSIEAVSGLSRRELVGTAEMQYGGFVGEVKRIVHEYRKGVHEDAPVIDPGYDVIVFEVFSDEVMKRGAGLWTGEWTVTFIDFASKIVQEAVRDP